MKKRICGATIFVCLIVYILFGYYGFRLFGVEKPWAWGLFIFLLVPLMPFILGIKRPYITYTLVIVIIYLVIGFAFNGWHPWWVLFLTIPVYYDVFGANFSRIKSDKEKKKLDDEKK